MEVVEKNRVFSYAAETLDTCLAEILTLAEDHFKETSRYTGGGFSPDIEAYQATEKLGALGVFTLRDEDRHLRGYCLMIIRRHHHSAEVRATEDLLYIQPSCRGNGRAFVAWMDACLASVGAQVVYRAVQSLHNHGRMYERLGYSVSEITYAKELPHG